MTQFTAKSNDEIIETVNTFRRKSLPKLSNYYGLNKEYDNDIYIEKDVLIIRQRAESFSRLYFMTFDEEHLLNCLENLPDGIFVYNLPVKNGLKEWEQFVSKSCFARYAEYQRLYNMDITKGFEILSTFACEESDLQSKGYKIAELATESDAYDLHKLLIDSFDKYTDYIPHIDEVKNMIANKSIYINKDSEDNVIGVIGFTYTGKKCYQNFWLDKSEMGLYLMKKVYQRMIDDNITYTNFWVANWNKAVLRLHKTLGSKPDGMLDYTYIKTKTI